MLASMTNEKKTVMQHTYFLVNIFLYSSSPPQNFCSTDISIVSEARNTCVEDNSKRVILPAGLFKAACIFQSSSLAIIKFATNPSLQKT